MKRIFLTGPTSFLGTKFIELYGDKYDIFGIARSISSPTDLMDFSAVSEAFNSFKPDIVIHMAADLERDHGDSKDIRLTDPAITGNLVNLAKSHSLPIIFTSTEAVYGGKEEGNYTEDDDYNPRSAYGESKAESEKIIRNSGLPHLITRGHRYVGVSKKYQRSKQFPDTIGALLSGKEVHLDDQKIFKPTLINNLCDIFDVYIEEASAKKVIINVGVDQATTYYKLICDIAERIGLNRNLIKADGYETGWPQNSSLDLNQLKLSAYPEVSYELMLDRIEKDFRPVYY